MYYKHEWGPHEVPTEDKLNHIEEGIEQASSSADRLPAVTTSDNGKVLTVVSGKWAKKTVVKELPAYTAADAGKVLQITADGLAWVTLE